MLYVQYLICESDSNEPIYGHCHEYQDGMEGGGSMYFTLIQYNTVELNALCWIMDKIIIKSHIFDVVPYEIKGHYAMLHDLLFICLVG